MVSMSLTNTILHTFDSPQFDMHGVQYKSNLNHQLFLSLRTRPSIPQASLTYWSLQVQILFPPHIYFFTFSQHNLSDLSLFSFLLYPFLRSILPLNTQFTKFFLFLHKIFWLYFYLLFNFIFFLLNLLPYSDRRIPRQFLCHVWRKIQNKLTLHSFLSNGNKQNYDL